MDVLGVLFMLLALSTGWLPGPGGIPLFVLGLSILAINHEWAQKYTDEIKDYIERIGKTIFTKDKNVRLAYDIFCPPLVAGGFYLLWLHNAPWQISLGVLMIVTGITVLAGNRNRFQKFKKLLKKTKND